MSVINTGKTFANGEQLTADKLNQVINQATFNASEAVDGSTITLISGAMAVNDSGITEAKIGNGAVTTNKIADGNVTKAKIENVTNMTVLGNTSGSAAAPQEVSVLDEDDMTSNSATALATQQSIKAYVDGAPNFTPSTYAGGESVTLPNGLIIKFGTFTSTIDTDQTFSFDTAFPTACVSVTTGGMVSGNLTKSASGFTINRFDTLAGSIPFFWQAIGY
jgi:hypothetical protein